MNSDILCILSKSLCVCVHAGMCSCELERKRKRRSRRKSNDRLLHQSPLAGYVSSRVRTVFVADHAGDGLTFISAHSTTASVPSSRVIVVT